jgi:beta-lactamase class A
MAHARTELRSRIADILNTFCGRDEGRSVAFTGHVPVISPISVRGADPRPAASVIKIPFVMALFRLAAQQRINLGATVAVDRFSTTRYVSILAAFDRDHKLSIREVCRLALITSDNPLAVYLQTLVDFDSVNSFLQEIGCEPPCRMAAGFSEEELSVKNRANILTANAAVRILSVLRGDPIFHDLVVALQNNLRNNRIPALLPEHVAVIHKTGSLDGVANDVGIVRDDKVEFTVAFLTDQQKDPIQTSNDIAAASLRVYDALVESVGSDGATTKGL